MIYKIELFNVKPKPKPRGQLGKHGNMTHSLNGYRQWQKDSLERLISINFKMPENFYGIFFHFYIKQARGGRMDVSNVQGAIEDLLVKGGYLKDDNWMILSRYAAQASKSLKNSCEIWVCQNREEWLKICQHLFKE